MSELKVDFFFVGPSKTASTWMFVFLSKSEEIFLPPGKDLYFFDQFFDRGFTWYHSQYRTAGSQLLGDISHDYILCEQALERISAYNPDAKIITCLRNPFDRLQSGLRFLVRNGYRFNTLDEAITHNPELVEGGLYGRNVARLRRLFGENVLALDFQLLKDAPETFSRQVSTFLGIPEIRSADLPQSVNKAMLPRSARLSRLVKVSAKAIRNAGGGTLVGKLKMNPRLKKLLYREGQLYTLNQFEKAILAEYFNPDIEMLAANEGTHYLDWLFNPTEA